MPKRSGGAKKADRGGCRSNESERPDFHHMRARCRTLADDDVEL